MLIRNHSLIIIIETLQIIGKILILRKLALLSKVFNCHTRLIYSHRLLRILKRNRVLIIKLIRICRICLRWIEIDLIMILNLIDIITFNLNIIHFVVMFFGLMLIFMFWLFISLNISAHSKHKIISTFDSFNELRLNQMNWFLSLLK